MIRELVVGTALIGGGGYYFVTHSTSAAVVRTVNASPQETWRAFDLVLKQATQELARIREDEARYPDGTPITPPIVISIPAKEIDFRLAKGGAEGIRVNLTFEPLGERQTKMTMRVDVASNLIPAANAQRLGGSLGFKRALNEMADKLIPEIESGRLASTAETFLDMRRKIETDPRVGEMRRQEEEYERREAQAAASAPMLDPNKAALDPKGADVTPTSRGTRY